LSEFSIRKWVVNLILQRSFKKYEVIIKFSNGDKVEGSFISKERAMEFLKFIAINN